MRWPWPYRVQKSVWFGSVRGMSRSIWVSLVVGCLSGAVIEREASRLKIGRQASQNGPDCGSPSIWNAFVNSPTQLSRNAVGRRKVVMSVHKPTHFPSPSVGRQNISRQIPSGFRMAQHGQPFFDPFTFFRKLFARRGFGRRQGGWYRYGGGSGCFRGRHVQCYRSLIVVCRDEEAISVRFSLHGSPSKARVWPVPAV